MEAQGEEIDVYHTARAGATSPSEFDPCLSKTEASLQEAGQMSVLDGRSPMLSSAVHVYIVPDLYYEASHAVN